MISISLPTKKRNPSRNPHRERRSVSPSTPNTDHLLLGRPKDSLRLLHHPQTLAGHLLLQSQLPGRRPHKMPNHRLNPWTRSLGQSTRGIIHRQSIQMAIQSILQRANLSFRQISMPISRPSPLSLGESRAQTSQTTSITGLTSSHGLLIV